MNPNLTTYYMAEQTNRHGLSARAERSWRARQADVRHPRTNRAAGFRSMTGAMLIRLGTHVGGFDPARTYAAATETPGQA